MKTFFQGWAKTFIAISFLIAIFTFAIPHQGSLIDNKTGFLLLEIILLIIMVPILIVAALVKQFSNSDQQTNNVSNPELQKKFSLGQISLIIIIGLLIAAFLYYKLVYK